MIDLIKDRLAELNPLNPLEQEYSIKQILQEIALYGLWRADFFEAAAFQGGTSLRILHGMQRFSEDLDFILKETDPEFDWSFYIEGMLSCFLEFGLKPEIRDKSRMDQRIKKAIIKESAVSHQLNLVFPSDRQLRVQKIKLEIDVTPPENSEFGYTYLDFPLDFEICHQNLPSNFALKIHALLCRPFLKGRDWYDFTWYIKKNVPVNIPHLQAALFQWGPWANQPLPINLEWLRQAMTNKIAEINWQEASEDVRPFLKPQEQHGLKLWSEHFFLSKLNRITA